MRIRTYLALAGLTLLAALPARAARFEITPGRPNEVVFESRAPMETVQGKTRQAVGWIVTPEEPGDSVEVRIEVDLASLDTGIDLRNQHMRKNHLETDRFPFAVFHGVLIDRSLPFPLGPGGKVEATVTGTFELHGIARRIEVPVQIVPEVDAKGRRALRVHSEFAVRLPDYDIPRPQFLVMKLDETQRITLDLLAVETGGAAAPVSPAP